MAQPPDTLRKLSLLGLAVLAILFIGGIVFYRERLFFCDASYIAYNIIKYDRLFIQEHRYGSFITQLVPWLGGRLHLPLVWVLKSYAFSFNLFYLVIGVAIYRCRQYSLLLIMALTYTLLVSDTYFWTNNEIHQALAWMFLFFAVVFRMAERRVSLPVLLPVFLLLAALALYTHFIVIIPMAFLWVYFWLQRERWYWSKPVSLMLTACFIAIVASKFIILNNVSYDAGHLHNVTHFSIPDIIEAIHAGVVKKFAWRMVAIYWVSVMVLIAGIISLVKNNKRTLVAWTVLSIIGYAIIMGLTYTNSFGDILLFHIESEWESMAVIIATPFVCSFLPGLQWRSAALILVAVFAVRCYYISASYPKFAWRTHFKEKILQEMRRKNISKLGLIVTPNIRTQNIQDWAMPEESILMSAVHGDMPQRTFCLVDAGDSTMLKMLADPGTIHLSYEPGEKGKTPSTYFKQDSTRPYTIMTYEELVK